MKKKITSMVIAFAMIFSVVGATTAQVSAGSIPFMMTSGDREKTGDWYVWVGPVINYNTGEESLQLKVKKNKNNDGKTIKKPGKSEQLAQDVVTDGNTIYYAVWNMKQKKSTIYKTTVSGKKHTVVRTIKNCTSAEPVTVYNGRLYFQKIVKKGYNLYSVKLNNTNCRLEKEGFQAQSAYGRYITLDNNSKTVKTQLYNAATKKSTKLIYSKQSRVFKDSIYYSVKQDGKAYVKKTNLKGKKLTTLKSIKGKAWNVEYVGKRFAVFENNSTDAKKKLTYSTKKLVNVPEDF